MKTVNKSDGLTIKPSKKPVRVDAHYVSHEIQHLLHFEAGFLFTVRELLLKPGKSVQEFLFDDRSKYVKPYRFFNFHFGHFHANCTLFLC